MLQKEKLLVMINFFFCLNVSKSCLLQMGFLFAGGKVLKGHLNNQWNVSSMSQLCTFYTQNSTFKSEPFHIFKIFAVDNFANILTDKHKWVELLSVENIVAKEEITYHEQFLLLSQCVHVSSVTEAPACGKGLISISFTYLPHVQFLDNKWLEEKQLKYLDKWKEI